MKNMGSLGLYPRPRAPAVFVGAFFLSVSDPMPCWSVDLIRARTQHLGTVVAANEKEAIAVARKRKAPDRANWAGVGG